MSMGPLGMISSAAGSPLQQAKGSESERTVQETASQARQTQSEQRAELAAGVGHTEQHEHASDRDADGRRLWEKTTRRQQPDHPASPPDSSAARPPAQSKDPTGCAGAHLDLSG